MARQHVPRLRLRRAVGALLVLVRAEPGRGAGSTRASRRSAPTRVDVARRARRARARRAPAPTCSTAALGRATRSAGGSTTTRGDWTARGADLRDRAVERAGAPGRARARRLRGRRSSTPRAGTTTTTSPGARVAVIGTGASAVQFVPQIQPRGRAADASSSAPPQWVLPKPDRRVTRRRAGALPPRAARAARAARSDVLRLRAGRLRASATRARCAASSGSRARAPASARCADPALRARADARPHARLQADPLLERLVPRARRGRTSSSCRTR